MRASICVANSGKWETSRDDLEFDRIPHIGECFSLGGNSLYKVVMVVTHHGFGQPAYYNIYTVKTDLVELGSYL